MDDLFFYVEIPMCIVGIQNCREMLKMLFYFKSIKLANRYLIIMKKFWRLTRVLLRGHLSVHDIAEVFQPILLVALRLASKQEAAVRRHYGDAVLPGAVAVGASRQAGGGVVAVVLVPQKHLTFGKGVL